MTELVQLSEHVWMVPPAPNKLDIRPAVGVVMSSSQTLLYDAGNSPRQAREIIAALKELNAPPVRYVVYSHAHWDHIFGAQALVDEYGDSLDIVAHERCVELLRDYAARPWGLEYVQRVARENPRLRGSYQLLEKLIDWDNFRIIMPTLIFADAIHTLHLGDDVEVELEWVGGQHSADSTIMRVPDERVMFLSDSFYPPTDGSSSESDPVMMQRFLAEKQQVYIDGHNGRIWSTPK
jgi:glyoxylase-like metal-dependent hydrolase (beta-lactamase superfamily II)